MHDKDDFYRGLMEMVDALHERANNGQSLPDMSLAIDFIKVRNAMLASNPFNYTGPLEALKAIATRLEGEPCSIRPGTLDFYRGRRNDHDQDLRNTMDRIKKANKNTLMDFPDVILPCKTVDDIVYGVEVLFLIKENYMREVFKTDEPVTPPPSN